MENQANIGDQNTQQIGQNPVNQSDLIPEKPKLNRWIISTVVLVLLLVLGTTFYFFEFHQSKKQVDNNGLAPTEDNRN